MADSEAHLQLLLNKFVKYGKDDRLGNNLTKPKIMSFSPRQCRHYEPFTIECCLVKCHFLWAPLLQILCQWLHDAMSGSKAKKTFFVITGGWLHDFNPKTGSACETSAYNILQSWANMVSVASTYVLQLLQDQSKPLCHWGHQLQQHWPCSMPDICHCLPMPRKCHFTSLWSFNSLQALQTFIW